MSMKNRSLHKSVVLTLTCGTLIASATREAVLGGSFERVATQRR